MWEHGKFSHQGMANQNVAADDAHVEQQIGAIYGNTAFHRNESVYHINQGDPPERRHQVAINHLDGGDPRHAEEMLRALLRDGYKTTERVYYYLLAALSDRSLDEIHGEIARSIVHAYQTYDRGVDAWRNAIEVVWQLLRCMRQEIAGALDQDLFNDTLSRFTALPSVRQAQITRHLDKILSGLVQNRVADAGARWIMAERMEPGRVERAWKFFQPDPAEPRRAIVSRHRAGTVHLRRMVLGGLAFLVGLATLPGLAGHNPGLAVMGVLLLAIGGYVALHSGMRREVLAIRLSRAENENGPWAPQPEPVSPGHWVSTGFVEELFAIVDGAFRSARPHTSGDWLGDTSGVRGSLKQRLLDLYGNAQVPASSIGWLARWHADRAAARWRAGDLFDYRARFAMSGRTNALFTLGVAVAISGLVAMTGAGAFGAVFFLGAGGFFLGKGAIAVFALRRADGLAQAEADRRYDDELVAYQDWVARLSDRPTDAEMARWLAMDKAFLKTAALKRLRLAEHDLVDHIVMTEGARGAMRARVLHGPPRYSAYVVYIFLLTRTGVRQITVELDFLQGRVHNESRNAFRYETLASASVQEKGVRVANDRWAGQPAGADVPLENERLRTRSFRLTLVSGEDISVLMENFRNFSDAQLENESELFRLALQTSGVASALHVLEAVAAEGPEWITRENERRRQWSRSWDDDGPDPETDIFSMMNWPTPDRDGAR